MSQPLDPDSLKVLYEFEGGPMGWFVRGHVDPGAFAQAVMEREPSTEPVKAELVRWEHWRNVPAPHDPDKRMLSVRARGPGRGAYPVTVIEQ